MFWIFKVIKIQQRSCDYNFFSTHAFIIHKICILEFDGTVLFIGSKTRDRFVNKSR